MTSGRTFFRKIDDAITTINSQLNEATAKFDQLTRQKTATRQRIAEAFQQIARVQADAIDTHEIQANDALSKDADRITERRNTARDALKAMLGKLGVELDTARKAEAAAQAARDCAAGALDVICRRVDEGLGSNDNFKALALLAKDADGRAQAAVAKAVAADQERASKAGAYETDPVFMYLRNRGFGAASYRANSLVRTIDGWLANLCGYDRAAKDYESLTLLPTYLSDHARTMQSAAVDTGERVRVRRRDALEGAGVEAAEQALAGKEETLASAATAVEAIQDRIQEAHAAINSLAKWQDKEGAALLERMSEAFAEEGLQQLSVRVAATADVEDDDRLDEIRKLRNSIAEIDEETAGLTPKIKSLTDRASSLASVKRQYKSKGYDSSDYTISGSSSSGLLEGFLLGTVVSGDLWRGIERSASYDPPQTSSSSSSGGGFDFGGGGGFSSGGGFGGGGGGFSTGGGF
jgi:chromosome segregation ATPase